MSFLPFLGASQRLTPNDFGLTPAIVRAQMARGMGEISLGDVDVTVVDRRSYKVEILKKASDGKKLIDARFVFNLMARAAQAENLELDPALFGRAIGLRLMQNALRFSFWTNIARINFDAASQMGGYVWAHNGATIETESMRTLSPALSRRIMAVKPFMDPFDYFPLQDAARLSAPGDLHKIANAQQLLTREQVEVAFEHLRDPLLVARLRQNALIRRDSVSVAAFALAGTHYSAHVDVHDTLPNLLLARHIRIKENRLALPG